MKKELWPNDTDTVNKEKKEWKRLRETLPMELYGKKEKDLSNSEFTLLQAAIAEKMDAFRTNV